MHFKTLDINMHGATDVLRENLTKLKKIQWIEIITANMVSRIMVQKSSAKHLVTREFSQKGFAISIFGHR